ncbi:aquaporin-4-like [Musca vetustissima]|uniref:aquaporin-4-like n=1 Tax=Musca vetustissima TaxID=27455 RepID=UPI002AB5F94F|nr:aquaporin-4-like [Musca vetustissima]
MLSPPSSAVSASTVPLVNAQTNQRASMDIRLKLVLQCFFAEFFGTAMVLFSGCMGALETGLFDNSHFQYSLNMALMVMVAVQCFGHVSGGHINPAVTLAGWICGVVKFHMVLAYFVGQFLGSIAGFGLLKLIVSTDNGFCMTLPGNNISTGQAFAIEFVITSILITVCCSTWDDKNSKFQDSLALRLGLTVGTLLFSAGNLSGGSMSPVRSFGPALWSMDFTQHWIYFVAPMSASLVTSLVYKAVFMSTQEMASHLSIHVVD